MVIIDADGHVHDHDEAVFPYLPEPFAGKRGLFRFPFMPPLDPWHRTAEAILAGANPAADPVTVEQWRAFLDDSGIAWSVLYPSGRSLGINLIGTAEWAVALARAYNDWLADTFLRPEPRLKGVAQLALQDVDAAVLELRHAVEDLGMIGGVLMTTGLRRPLGDEYYHPLYAEAERLDVPLAVHAGGAHGLGLDDLFSSMAEVRPLTHMTSQMYHCLSLIYGGVYEVFPRLRVAHLEAGCGWVLPLIERMDRIYRGRSARRSLRKLTLMPSEVLAGGRIFFHTELDERLLGTAAEMIGRDDVFLFASDLPHEPAAEIKAGIREFVARDDLRESTKRGVLCEASLRLYREPGEGG
jgi:predicted TIM-barrel fold metal-dependent hydrolase